MKKDDFVREMERIKNIVTEVEVVYQVPKDVMVTILSDYVGATDGAVNRITREMSHGHARRDHVAKLIMDLKRDGVIG